MVKKIFTVIITILAAVMTASAITAPEVLEKASGKLSAAKGIVCDFTISGQGGSGKGTLKVAGNKFSLTTPVSSAWYNGKSLYTYSTQTAETTVVTPTASELAETNPMMYVRNYKSSFNAVFPGKMPRGTYIIDLLPKKRGSSVKKVTIVLSAVTFLPMSFTIEAGGQKTMIKLGKVSLDKSIPAGDFEYPSRKYPKAQIVDLR